MLENHRSKQEYKLLTRFHVKKGTHIFDIRLFSHDVFERIDFADLLRFEILEPLQVTLHVHLVDELVHLISYLLDSGPLSAIVFNVLEVYFGV